MTQSNDKRAVLIVLDSVGIGEAPDADAFGDVGADTLGHIAQTVDGFDMPNMRRLGLGNISGVDDVAGVDRPRAHFGRMQETSPGKDTTSGHWEFAGVLMDKPFRTFPEGFPDDIIEAFCREIGVDGVLGNRPESGTVIIEELGREHARTGQPIVYTSADPVFQIAAHLDVVDLDTLYEWCRAAYDIVTPRGISRVIARPFVGQWPSYERTSERKDFAFPPPSQTMMEALVDRGIDVTGVGKIGDIYSGRGITDAIHTDDNDHGVEVTGECIDQRSGFIFTNLVDFDSKYGHRRNPRGYGQCLERFDAQLPGLVERLDDGDLLIITADHGNDPTYSGTDHTREYVPLIAQIKGDRGSQTAADLDLADLDLADLDLGTRTSFSDIGATVADYFGVDWEVGTSFLEQLR